MWLRKTFTCIRIWKTLETLTTLCSSGTKLLLPSWLLGFFFRFSTRGERDTIFSMLTVPSDPTTRGASRRPNWTGLAEAQKSSRFAQVRFATNCFFFKNHPKSLAHRFRAWRHSHPHSHFRSGVFIMTSVIVTSSPYERKHLRSMCAPVRALSRIVLSLTKPKDKI